MKTLAIATNFHKRAEVLRDEYLNAKPWLHVVVENGFRESFLDAIADEVGGAPPGGYTKIHRDFEMHPDTGLFHRVNLLVYLNRDWPDSYGGSLELWPSDMSKVGRCVFPRFNTMILWETHGGTLHGLPDPVRCPPNRMRLSVASYYYTKVSVVGDFGTIGGVS